MRALLPKGQLRNGGIMKPEVISMKINTVLEIMQWVNQPRDFDMYRGQADEKWQLLPSIVRYATHVKYGYAAIVDLETHLVEWFEKYSTPYKDYRSVSYLEKLIDGQHYGLPTRLLDWTTNPLKALYFAVENPDFDSKDGAIYGFTPKSWWEGTKNVKLDDELGTFFPELLNQRLAAQEGCYTSFPLPGKSFHVLPMTINNYPKDINLLEKIIIEAQSKAKIRSDLNKLGINQRTIYPGLDGVAKWVKSDLSNYGL
jgi:hypothetical protein